jgi:hypothetical protein
VKLSIGAILAILEALAKLYVFFDNQRLQREAELKGMSEADAAANAVQLARIKSALAARVAVPSDGQPDPDDRDTVH